MGTGNKETKFDNVYYLAKNKRPVSNYPEAFELPEKNGEKDIRKAYSSSKKYAKFTNTLPVL